MTRLFTTTTTALLLLLAAIPLSYGLAQDPNSIFGVGASVGGVMPKTDVNQSPANPFGRMFLRYYTSPKFAFEAGLGLGTLKAEDGTDYFSTPIYPLDIRLMFHPFKVRGVEPYLYAGAGLLFFSPRDRNDQALPRNANGEYRKAVPFLPYGIGFQVPVADRTFFGLSLGANPTTTENLDDIKSGKKDSFVSVMLNFFAVIKGGDDDPDKDGLKTDEERVIGTNPLNADTDGDGLKDGEEVRTYKTNPLNPDTDGDGLKDGEEIFRYHTDPLKFDTDNDGLSDGDEVNTYHTDPLKFDTDGDGLSDGDEVLKYHTDPLKVDTDGDGLTDAEEVLTYHTDPLKTDTDGDGLSDGDEVHKYHTDPLKVDTDNGGMPDGKEVQLGLNPLDPSDDVPVIKVGERIILEGVNFETGKTTLLPGAKVILDKVAQSLATAPSAEVAIHGHTDNVGGAKYNMNLSQGRANAVKAYLVSKGIEAARISTKGYGYTKPIGDNATPEGRAKNRRIEFVRIK